MELKIKGNKLKFFLFLFLHPFLIQSNNLKLLRGNRCLTELNIT